MSYYALNQAIRDYSLPVHEKAVLWVLESYMTKENLWAYPSQETISEQCGMSLSSTKRAVAALREKDLIRTKLKYVGESRVCCYQINRAALMISESVIETPSHEGESVKTESESVKFKSESVRVSYNK